MPLTPDNRSELRSLLRARRRALDAAGRERASRALATRLLTLATVDAAARLAAYVPFDGEIDPLPFLHAARAAGRQVYLPRLGGDGRLEFVAWHPGLPLVPNRFGILEPADGEVCAARALDVVIAPLVAFDAAGNRLGMGGGWYDRTFAFLKAPDRPAKPHLIGVAYEFQRVPQLPSADWDVPLDGVATDAGWYPSPGGNGT
ncbi:MAG TPA: 5-formyltetrahydrofolate cyclo-ligase [Gammaproteobacteria bacterium]|nr:5-formyltetrahydrofolate cyclo-ligase [Gammaproteobacteria bacterium]